MTNLWTKLTVLWLVLNGIGGLYSIFVLELPPLWVVTEMELMFVLAIVVWMETRWGTLLVVLVGLILILQSLISAALNLVPEWGTQTEQFLYIPFVLLMPVLAYLSYRKITEQS